MRSSLNKNSISMATHTDPMYSFVSPAKLPLLNPKRRVQPVFPILAIEIVSENDRFDALMKKARRYRSAGRKRSGSSLSKGGRHTCFLRTSASSWTRTSRFAPT